MVILSSELELQKNEIDEETSDSEETETCVGAGVPLAIERVRIF